MDSSAPNEPGTQDSSPDPGFTSMDWGKGLLFMRIPVAEPFRSSYLGTTGVLRGTDPHHASDEGGEQQQPGGPSGPVRAQSPLDPWLHPWWLPESMGGSPANPDAPSALLHPLDRVAFETGEAIKAGSLLLLGVLLVTVGAAALLFANRDTIVKVASKGAA